MLGAACMPHIMMRLHPIRDARTARRTIWAVAPVALLCTGIVVVGLGASALVGRDLLRAADPAGGTALLMVTGALDPGASGPRDSPLFALVACAAFATTLAAVAGITLAAASSVTRDFAVGSGAQGEGKASRKEIRRARWAVAAIGALAGSSRRTPTTATRRCCSPCRSRRPPRSCRPSCCTPSSGPASTPAGSDGPCTGHCP